MKIDWDLSKSNFEIFKLNMSRISHDKVHICLCDPYLDLEVKNFGSFKK